MNLSFSAFWNISDLDAFCNRIYFSDCKDDYGVESVSSKKSILKQKKNCIFHEGYIYKQKDNLVIVENNEIDGWVNKTRVISLKYNLKSFYIFANDESIYPGYKLYAYNCGEERNIYAIKDGAKWVFNTEGPKQLFEGGDTYSERLIKEKFNYKKILAFCRNMGVDISDENFFTPISTLYHSFRL